MANTIRHKRGTSDPSASDFSATAELLINTADGGLFTKKDDGSVVEIGGGGGGGSTTLSSDAQRNTVGGTNAGDSFTGTDATDNTLIGYDAGTDITTADYNSFYGSYAGENCTTGSSNCAYGFEAGEALTTGQKNVFIGYEAARSSTINQNCVAIGYQALRDNVDGNDASWEGIVAVGMEAGRSSTGKDNTYLGFKAGQSPSDGTGQVYVGYEAGLSNQGISNVAIGWKALQTYGQHSDGGSFSNAYNVGIGALCGYGTSASGRYNVMAGYQAMYARTSADSVVALGKDAGGSMTTGSDCVLIGANAGKTGTNDLTTGSNNILLGHDAAASSATVSNEVTIGDANVTKFRIPGLDSFAIDDNGTIDLPGAIDENVYECTGTELDPDLGTVQYKTLAANTTLTESLTAGQSMLLMVDDGTAYTVTWPTMTWVGGSAPTLATSGYTCIELWKIASTLYGCHVGDVA